jgi:hypothetical protein
MLQAKDLGSAGGMGLASYGKAESMGTGNMIDGEALCLELMPARAQA